MKVSKCAIIAVALLVIATALAGCATTQTSVKSGDFGQATPTSGGDNRGSGTSSGNAAGNTVDAGSLFGDLSYDWVEYRIVPAGQDVQPMTIYYKFNQKTGKCTMRFESTQKIEGLPEEMDCTPSGSGTSQSSADPNNIKADIVFEKAGTETVTVPAGTFVADKYTVAYQKEYTATYWFVPGKPFIKMISGEGRGQVIMELYDWG